MVRKGFVDFSSYEYKNFFEDGQLGSKHLYQAHTKPAPERTIENLSEKIKDGALNIDALNSGEEILVAYKGRIPPFKVGGTVTICSATACEGGYGIEELVAADVKIGALLQIPSSIGKANSYVVRNDHEYNFSTTAAARKKWACEGGAAYNGKRVSENGGDGGGEEEQQRAA